MQFQNLSLIRLFIKLYALALSFFTVFRVVLFSVEYSKIGEGTGSEVFEAFVMGLRFDSVICSYILVLPFLVLCIHSFFGDVKPITKSIIFYFIFLLFCIAFMVCAADIPYFSQFFSRFSVAAFEWLDTPGFVLKMVIQEPRYWIYILLFLILTSVWYILLKKIITQSILLKNTMKLYVSIPIGLLAVAFIFLGIRGRLEEKSPIRVGTAYFCNNAFLNQLGLNPNFTLIKSYLDSKKHKTLTYLDNTIAVKNMQSYLGIINPISNNSLSRKINYSKDSLQKHNVVIVIMESMSAYHTHKDGNTQGLTPFLDSMSNTGYYFNKCYTAGIHTHNGIFSTLFSFPAMANQHSMKESGMKPYIGIAATLKQNNYSTIYFTTHDGQFDNVEGFLKNNQFETVISKKDYPSDKVKTTLGVPDDYMFEFAIPVLTNLHNKQKPFLSVFMTASNHGPYYLPEYYKPRTTDIKQQIVEYSDWSIKQFINKAKQQPWFNNTLFVFIADHGAAIRNTYDISLDYVHAPLIFYAPSIIKQPKVFGTIASQIDVYPSVMSLLNLSYTNTTMGIDVFKQNRTYAIFNSHDDYGVLDTEWLLILKQDNSIGLFKYQNNDLTNYADTYPDVALRMKTYLVSHLQANQFLNK